MTVRFRLLTVSLSPQILFYVLSLNVVGHLTVKTPAFDLELPEGATKWGFVSGCKAGLRHHHDSLPKSKESQIRALEKGCHQPGSPESI